MLSPDVTLLLERAGRGDAEAANALLEHAYGELRRLAASHMRRERPDHTLNATGLVHEAWLKLAEPAAQSWQNRAHFFGAASQAMRRVLIDHARGRAADKRRGETVSLTAVDAAFGATPTYEELLHIDAALERLARVHERSVRVVECRYFGGLTIPETAEALGVSHATVSDDWRFARAWLFRALAEPARDPA